MCRMKEHVRSLLGTTPRLRGTGYTEAKYKDMSVNTGVHTGSHKCAQAQFWKRERGVRVGGVIEGREEEREIEG